MQDCSISSVLWVKRRRVSSKCSFKLSWNFPQWIAIYTPRIMHTYHEVLAQLNRIPWWRHQMETLSALLALSEGNPPLTGGFPSQRPVTRSFDVSLCCAWTNNCDAGVLRRHRAHHDVTVFFKITSLAPTQPLRLLHYQGNSPIEYVFVSHKSLWAECITRTS